MNHNIISSNSSPSKIISEFKELELSEAECFEYANEAFVDDIYHQKALRLILSQEFEIKNVPYYESIIRFLLQRISTNTDKFTSLQDILFFVLGEEASLWKLRENLKSIESLLCKDEVGHLKNTKNYKINPVMLGWLLKQYLPMAKEQINSYIESRREKKEAAVTQNKKNRESGLHNEETYNKIQSAETKEEWIDALKGDEDKAQYLVTVEAAYNQVFGKSINWKPVTINTILQGYDKFMSVTYNRTSHPGTLTKKAMEVAYKKMQSGNFRDRLWEKTFIANLKYMNEWN